MRYDVAVASGIINVSIFKIFEDVFLVFENAMFIKNTDKPHETVG